MTIDEVKAFNRRVPEEMFNKRNLALADELFAAEYVEHAPAPPGLPAGIAGLKLFAGMLLDAFPDFRYQVDDVIAEGDKAVLRVTANGTQRGNFQGVPATNKHAMWTETHICRMAGGKIVEHWVDLDRLGMLQQLGLAPTPGQPGG